MIYKLLSVIYQLQAPLAANTQLFKLNTAVLVLLCSCQVSHCQEIEPKFTIYPVDCSVRALEVVDEDQVWFAGSNGRVGYTIDGGTTWHMDSIQNSDVELEFRSIAVTRQAVMLLAVASPAYLYRSVDRGKTWKVVYREDHAAAFYDSMKFWDQQNGIAMGDPTAECLSVILTDDGGKTWNKVPCDKLPKAVEGEAAFAASNSNLSLYRQHAWMVSGGTKARIFHSPDRGNSWEVFQSPIVEGGSMTGIFSVDFYDEKRGVVFGGNWEDKKVNQSNKAMTSDGGKSWALISDGEGPGYRSCVQFVSGSNAKQVFAVGPTGIDYSADAGASWQPIDRQDFYTIRLVKGINVAWLAGKGKIAKMEW